ncbi:MAG: Lsm family RNA-binding protein [Thaumarchaeota archaeon]|nr:Lsm family RNA-binding protein [Nitrososphaerota archaeon]
MGRQFDINALAKQLIKSFPDMVRIAEDAQAIIVMDRIKVTKDGVQEGTGPVAERVRTIYAEYMQQEEPPVDGGYSPINPRTGMETKFRCYHCGLTLSGRVYRRKISGSLLMFCCKQCADHEETESRRPQGKVV